MTDLKELTAIAKDAETKAREANDAMLAEIAAGSHASYDHPPTP